MSKVYVITACEEEGFEISKNPFSDSAKAMSVVASELHYYGSTLRSARYDYQNKGVGYQIFEDEGGWEHVIGIANEDKVSEIEEVINKKRNKLFNK